MESQHQQSPVPRVYTPKVSKMKDPQVDREEFERKLNDLIESQTGPRIMWDRAHLQKVKEILSGESPKDTSSYHYYRLYQLVQVGSELHVASKRTNDNEDFVYIVPTEEYYTKLWDAHRITGHGGRDRMHDYVKKRWRIPRNACILFISCCEVCADKKPSVRKRPVIVHQPIISYGFNARCQIDLIDYQSCPDGSYCFLLVVQDQATRFVQLRPLQNKLTGTVVEELYKIFLIFGAPAILQCDSGDRSFASEVVKALIARWPKFRMIHGRPRLRQTQESVERANSDIKKMIEAWMTNNKSENWSKGCYEVQWQRNTSKHKTFNRSPYEAVFGPIKNGLSQFNLPEDVMMSVQTEEELEEALRMAVPNSHPSQNVQVELTEGSANESVNLNEPMTLNNQVSFDF